MVLSPVVVRTAISPGAICSAYHYFSAGGGNLSLVCIRALCCPARFSWRGVRPDSLSAISNLLPAYSPGCCSPAGSIASFGANRVTARYGPVFLFQETACTGVGWCTARARHVWERQQHRAVL